MSTLSASAPYLLWLSVAYFRMLCKKIHYVSGILGETTRLELPSLLAKKMIHATANLANMKSADRIWKSKLSTLVAMQKFMPYTALCLQVNYPITSEAL